VYYEEEPGQAIGGQVAHEGRGAADRGQTRQSQLACAIAVIRWGGRRIVRPATAARPLHLVRQKRARRSSIPAGAAATSASCRFPSRSAVVPLAGFRCRPRHTWVDWWHSVCLNAQRIEPSCLPRNFGRLRSSGRCDCFARELRDYCDQHHALPARGVSVGWAADVSSASDSQQGRR
jgi:hypothetical protein